MSSLRRDLFERRLWPIAVILVAAIAAVPFLIGGHGRTSAATLADAPAPSAAAMGASPSGTATTRAAAGATKRSRHPAPGRSKARNPFVAGAGGSTSTSTTTTAGTTTTASTTSTTASSTSGRTSGASAAGSASASSAATPAATNPVTSASTATIPTATSTTTASSTTTPATTPSTTSTISQGGVTVTVTHPSGKVSVRATVYGVNLRLTTPSARSSLLDLARFTPLPTATFPKAMFMGATDGGHDAVFALGTGVTASRPARCRPTPTRCSLIVVPIGRRERLHYDIDYSRARSMVLEVPSISARVVRSARQLSASVDRYSHLGACALEIGDPLLEQSYNAAGALSLGSPCTRNMKVAAFPGPASEGGQ